MLMARNPVGDWEPKWPLEGPRLLLRPFAATDIQPRYIDWLNDPRVVRFSNQRFRRHTVESSRSYLATFSGTSNLFLAIESRGTGQMFGTLTVYRSVPHQTADVGIMIGDVNFWRQGFGSEAFSVVVECLLSSGVVRKVTAGAMACNLPMISILERCDFKWEATRHRQELLDGEPVDILHFARFRED